MAQSGGRLVAPHHPTVQAELEMWEVALQRPDPLIPAAGYHGCEDQVAEPWRTVRFTLFAKDTPAKLRIFQR